MNRPILEPIYAYYQESQNSSFILEHHHSQYELILVAEGRVRFRVEQTKYELDAGDLILISALEKHSISILSFPYRRYVLAVSTDFCSMHIQEPLLLSILSHRPEGFCHKIHLDASLYPQAEQHFKLLSTEASMKEQLWQQRSLLLLNDLLILLFRSFQSYFLQKKDPSILHLVIQVQKYIGLHYSEPMTLDSVASFFYISKYYLSRVFKEVTGYGYKEYVLLYRLNQAKKMLESTNIPVLEISGLVGFKNVNHFIRVFRIHENTTPLQYRKAFILPYPHRFHRSCPNQQNR